MEAGDALITTVSHAELSRLQAALELERTARLRAELEVARLRSFLGYQRVCPREIVVKKQPAPVKQAPRELVTHSWIDGEWVETSRETDTDWLNIGDDHHSS